MTKKELEALTDRQLIDYLIAGNNEVVKFMFYDKCSKMFGFIVKEIFTYRVDKDELINELFLYLQKNNWDKVKKFNYQSRFTTWLSVVAVRYFIKKRTELIDSDPNRIQIEQMIQLKNHDQHDLFMEKMDLYKAISKLKTPRDRYVIMAIEIEGQDDAEVAKTLGVTVSNLYNIKSRALKQLSNIIKDYNYVN